MSENENLQALRRAYKAFAQGDISVLLNLLADDVDWSFAPSCAEIPWAQHAWRGRGGVAQVLGNWPNSRHSGLCTRRIHRRSR